LQGAAWKAGLPLLLTDLKLSWTLFEKQFARKSADRQELESIFREKHEEHQIQSSLILLRRALVRIEVSMDLEDVELFEEESEKREF
jgi:hypothetical protein